MAKTYYPLNAYGKTYKVRMEKSSYQSNGTLAVALIMDTEEPFGMITVNIAPSDIFADEKAAFIDTNNCPWAKEFLIENKIAFECGVSAGSGYCTYPLFEFDIDKLGE